MTNRIFKRDSLDRIVFNTKNKTVKNAVKSFDKDALNTYEYLLSQNLSPSDLMVEVNKIGDTKFKDSDIYTLIVLNTLFITNNTREFNPIWENHSNIPLNTDILDTIVYTRGEDKISFQERYNFIALSDKNPKLLNLLLTNYDSKELEFKDFLYHSSKSHFFNDSKEYFSLLINNKLYDYNDIEYQNDDNSFSRGSILDMFNEAQENEKHVSAFDMFYSLGIEYNETKLRGIFKERIQKIDSAKEYLIVNKDAIQHFITNVSKSFIGYKKNDNIDENIARTQEHLDKISSTMKGFQEDIKLGELKEERELLTKKEHNLEIEGR